MGTRPFVTSVSGGRLLCEPVFVGIVSGFGRLDTYRMWFIQEMALWCEAPRGENTYMVLWWKMEENYWLTLKRWIFLVNLNVCWIYFINRITEKYILRLFKVVMFLVGASETPDISRVDTHVWDSCSHLDYFLFEIGMPLLDSLMWDLFSYWTDCFQCPCVASTAAAH